MWESPELVPHEVSGRVYQRINFKLHIYFVVRKISSGTMTVSACLSEVRNICSGNTECLRLPFRDEEYRIWFTDRSASLSEVRNIGSGTVTVSAGLSEVGNIGYVTLTASA